MFTILFWRDAIERAVSTAAQSALALLGADGLLDVVNIHTAGVLSVAGGAALLSFLKSLVAKTYGDSQSASLDPHIEIKDPPGKHAA